MKIGVYSLFICSTWCPIDSQRVADESLYWTNMVINHTGDRMQASYSHTVLDTSFDCMALLEQINVGEIRMYGKCVEDF